MRPIEVLEGSFSDVPNTCLPCEAQAQNLVVGCQVSSAQKMDHSGALRLTIQRRLIKQHEILKRKVFVTNFQLSDVFGDEGYGSSDTATDSLR